MTAISQAADRITRLSRETPSASTKPPKSSAPEVKTPTPPTTPAGITRRTRNDSAGAVRRRTFRELGALTDEQRRDPDALLLRAVSLINCGQVEEAKQLCHEVLAGDDLNAETRYLLALCLEHAGDFEAAMEQDRAAIYLDERFAMPHLHLGLLNKRLKNSDAARGAFRQASALLPREDASRVLLFGGGFGRETLLRLCEAELRTTERRMNMSNEKESAKTDAAALRQVFDQVFAACPTRLRQSETDDFVAIRAGGRAIRAACQRTGMGGNTPQDCLAARLAPVAFRTGQHRGQFMPVYSLELVLGLPATAAVKPWIAIAAGEQQFGITFDALEGYFRIPRANILGEGTTEGTRMRTQQAVRVADELRPIVQLPAVFASIQDRVLSKTAAAQE